MSLDNDPFAAGMQRLGTLVSDPASLRTRAQEPQQKRRAKKPKPRVADKEKLQTEIINEDSVARQFATAYADKLLFCHGRQSWYVWNGSIWQLDQTDQVFQWVRELTRELCASEPKDRTRFVCNATRFAKGVEVFARSDPTFAVTAEAWDRDRFRLGTPRGTVDLESGKLLKSEPSDRITRSTAVTPSDRANCPLWLQFLDEATGGDTDLVRFLQQWCGYALTGDTREHALVFIYGPGGNGKSVLLNVLTAILNSYGAIAAMDTFTASKSDKHPTDLAMLRGARLVTASETEEGKPWAEARIKQMTGGDPITARYMRQDFFTFVPHFKLTIVGNHQPVLRNVDEAARRRFNIVPFTRKPERPDPQLEERLKAEYPAILRWMIDGCRDWHSNGLTRPASVVAATDDYFGEQDLFGHWLQDVCEVEPNNSYKAESSTILFQSWRAYAERAGEEAGSQKAFADNLKRRGFEHYRSYAGRGFKGIRLKPAQRSDHDA